MRVAGILALVLILGGCAERRSYENVPVGSLSEQLVRGKYQPTTYEQMKAIEPSREFQGQEVDLDGFEVTFEDEFNTMSVTGEDGAGPWYSPVHTPFGGSKFVGPREGKGPVLVRDGKLVIQMYRDEEHGGRWISSLVQSVNKKGEGFAQQYGYFEMKAKMAPGKATWGGLWLHSHPALTGQGVAQTEIDVAEIYGGDPKGHHATIHLWPAKKKDQYPGDLKREAGRGAYTKIPDMFEGFHTYGVMLTPEWIIFYYDRKEIVRMEAKPEFRTPQYVLIDLALLPKLYRHAKGLMEMEVDYVRVWQKTGGWE